MNSEHFPLVRRTAIVLAMFLAVSLAIGGCGLAKMEKKQAQDAEQGRLDVSPAQIDQTV